VPVVLVGVVVVAGPGRNDHDAPATGVPPGFQPLDLVRKRLLRDLESPWGEFVSTRSVGVGLLVLAEVFHDVAVPDRLGTELASSEIILHARQAGIFLRRRAIDDQGAGLEEQMQRPALANGRLAGRAHREDSPGSSSVIIFSTRAGLAIVELLLRNQLVNACDPRPPVYYS
jgi:hypothetical protein